MQRLRNGGRHIFCDLVEVPPVLHDDVRHRDVELLLDRHAELDPVEAVEIIALGRHRAALRGEDVRSEEHTSELQSLMRISYAVFCLNKKKSKQSNDKTDHLNTNIRT